jgi:CRP-like cAMP-binding protein
MYECILRNVARHIELTDEEKDYFTSILNIKKIRKRQYLLQEGDVCRYEYFVNKGCLRTYYIDNKGAEHVVQFAVEEWWIGEMYSFLTQQPARFNIDALEDTEVFYFDKAAWEELFIRVPKFERFFRILLQNAFIANQERIIASISQTAEERYLQFIQRYPQFEQRIPQHQVASFLGIAPESLSRIRKQLAEKR